MPQTFAAADGTLLAYSDEGAGLPLLCLPGLTRTMGDFDYLRPHLPPLRLIRMDYRGRGGSGWSGAATYTVPQEAQDVLALLERVDCRLRADATFSMMTLSPRLGAMVRDASRLVFIMSRAGRRDGRIRGMPVSCRTITVTRT